MHHFSQHVFPDIGFTGFVPLETEVEEIAIMSKLERRIEPELLGMDEVEAMTLAGVDGVGRRDIVTPARLRR